MKGLFTSILMIVFALLGAIAVLRWGDEIGAKKVKQVAGPPRVEITP